MKTIDRCRALTFVRKAALSVMFAALPTYGLAQGHDQGYVLLHNFGGFGVVVNGLTGRPVEAGSAFRAALYFAPDGVTDESQFFQLGNPAGFPQPGYFSGGTRSAPTGRGGFGMFQVRAWETAYGSTYEQAVANTTPQNGRLALAGKSGIMRVDTAHFKDPPQPIMSGEAVVGTHLRDGFTLTVVPEPAPLLLFLAGAAGVLIFRRFR